MSNSNKEEVENESTNLYIIITNSMQNDFIEQNDFNEQVKIGAIKDDPWKIGYEECRNEWMLYFKGKKPKGNKDIEDFIDKMKENITNPKPSDSDISYHEYIKKYKHRVHIDLKQSQRLWDNERLVDFIDDLMVHAKKENENSKSRDRYYFIHLRDWHDPSDPDEREELSNFGYHCIKGSHGAEFVKPLRKYIQQPPYDTFTQIINSNSLSSFTETKLDFILDSIVKNHKSSTEKATIGVYGVITNVKLKLLTFELKVIHNFKHVYLCDELSAGFSQHGHDEGIDYMRYNLGVNILGEEDFRRKFNFEKKSGTS
jgi:nicotinamidase-related amidase